MTKKHFNELAKQLAIVRPELGYDNYYIMFSQWDDCVSAVIRACRESNPRFDADKFRAACNR